MKWITAAGVVMLCWLGISGSAFGAGLVRVTPDGYLGSDPSFLTSPPDDSRVFIAERGDSGSHQAQVRIIKDGVPVNQPFLTIGNVDLVSERGLLSIAFAPDYATSGLFYAFYVAHAADGFGGSTGDIRIVEYHVSSGDPDKADPASARLVFSVPHSAGNHNGGWMAFGPDGDLYFSIGDNANGSNAQTLTNVYGKIMRIDPADPDGAGAATYTVPSDNPFVGEAGARTEIYALGLRNPYRASFTPDGRLVIGDVGNGTWEEVDVGDLKGANLGWPDCEGFCTTLTPSFAAPIYVYNHDNGVDNQGGGCAIIGGYVVRDESLGGLTGRYLYGDLCDDALRTLNLDAAGADPQQAGLVIPDGVGSLRSFGEDSGGCVYVLGNSAVYRVAPNGSTATACPVTTEPPGQVTYNSFIPQRRVIAKRLVVGAKCSIACTASATTKVRITRNRFRRKPAIFNLKTPVSDLAAGVRGKLTFQVPLKRVKAMKKAVRNGSRVTARVKVTLTGEDGSGGSGSGSIRLVRPKRR
ncbi:MAG: PQQ-dependent sugar dehydrogenase [Solirubrobacterales bacterium]|nr:PQQ-dependent sugar dehydrogenase [Solirubrobacterales bacterium]HRV59259.1 PQQ-dependent sugar dehydrogenase [Solirubrobacterales bacterium]